MINPMSEVFMESFTNIDPPFSLIAPPLARNHLPQSVPQQSQGIDGYKHGCARVGENGDPKTGHAKNRCNQEHCLETEGDSYILADDSAGFGAKA